MKKKILITSIFLGLTAIATVVYLGCSQQGSGTLSSRTEVDASSEEADVTWADITDKSDFEVQMTTEPQDNLSQLQKDVADVEWRLRINRDEPVKTDMKENIVIPAKPLEPGVSKITSQDGDVFFNRIGKEIYDSSDVESEEAKTKVVTGPIPVLGDIPLTGDLKR
ncbi:MAG: hypothetical protein ACYSR9_14880, partial [Planctomycetota bacterium]